MRAETLLETYYRDVWTEGNLDAIEGYFVRSAEAGGIHHAESMGPEDLRVLVQTVRALIRRPCFEILQTVERGEWVASRFAVHGTAVATGAPVRVEGHLMVRLEEGRFAEAHHGIDMLSAAIQIGALPGDALPRILGGERLS